MSPDCAEYTAWYIESAKTLSVKWFSPMSALSEAGPTRNRGVREKGLLFGLSAENQKQIKVDHNLPHIFSEE
jgi:hypothetical protein